MDPVRKALWYVESHSREPISLDEIARACKVSSFHLTRAFSSSVGLSLMRYVRARRLTEAARALAGGAEDILALALDVGYGSHEAFTRAFRDQFALTPEQVRAQGHLNNLRLMEAIAMTTVPAPDIAPPTLEERPPMLLAGLIERYQCQAPGGIPDQWRRFAPQIGRVPGQADRDSFGASTNFDADGNFDYMCGVRVSSLDDLPLGLKGLSIPAQTYAIFRDKGHIAGIRAVYEAIWRKWIPESGHKAAEAPTLERYTPEFDPATGLGGYEIWVPIQA
ncbi:AraC family transcriptional regulator [Singulisphaera sp. PoT]|uniref:AraC family transcriptional regulator n=1 Tax=Singulisphaera sp. PoT TaxID=3411797 RepID=UPI003BF46E96